MARNDIAIIPHLEAVEKIRSPEQRAHLVDDAVTFERAKAAAESFSLLIDAVASDEEYLERTLTLTAKFDDFVARQLSLLKRTADVRRANRRGENVISHLRSDYMLHAPTSSLMQVEINTVGVSFACLATRTAELHRYLLGRLGSPPEALEALPTNGALDSLAGALAAAVEAYGVAGAVVVMVVQPGERNLYDQQWAQIALWERHGVRTLRKTLSQLAESAVLVPHGECAPPQLHVDGQLVAVVYFRAGYVPEDYVTEDSWVVRETVERSDAFKLPSVAYQLAGAKKIQQDLAQPGRVEAFMKSCVADAADADQRSGLVRSLFAGLWSLDDLEADDAAAAAVADAMRAPERYVLKPQREGGGHNLYGHAMAARLAEGGPGLSAFVLMQRISPPVLRSVLVRDGAAREADTLSELGIYSVLVRQGRKIIQSSGGGHLVRTKSAESDEGGVAAGYGVLDSPYLV